MEQNFTQNPTCSLKIVLVGAGSIEKSKLAKQLSSQFTSSLKPEFKEIYFEEKAENQILETITKNYDLFFLINLEDSSAPVDNIENSLIQHNKPYILISGNEEERLLKTTKIVEDFVKATQLGFGLQDFIQIINHNVSIENIDKQLVIFNKGIRKSDLDRPAILNDGILPFSDEDFSFFSTYFDAKKDGYKLKKFVPASGAASRMFKFLSEYLNDFKAETESVNAYINRKKADNLRIFLAGIEKFPFFEAVRDCIIEEFPDAKSWTKDKQIYWFVKTLIQPDYFDYANKPKGILPFHKYKEHTATPVEEHLMECMHYAASNKVSNLHFTVSENHKMLFESIVLDKKQEVEQQFDATININFSYQNKATDTIAVSLENKPFRDENGKLMFRPGGHGALIDNLNQLDADIVFVKNIDNVIQNHIDQIALYKKALAGYLIQLQEQIFSFLIQIESGIANEIDLSEIIAFASTKLNIQIVDEYKKYTLENKINYLKELLDRPIRVCGMVINEGEPGGGPFWVADKKGNLSLQIIESTQVDMHNSSQQNILNQATHFNPVDLVCGLKNYQGNRFDLTQFVDHSTGFIVDKNHNGKPLKGYELPGLWNGGMALWITVFVQVPIITFNPVKTINDLLKPNHQPL